MNTTQESYRIPSWMIRDLQIELMGIYQELIDFSYKYALHDLVELFVADIRRDVERGVFRDPEKAF